MVAILENFNQLEHAASASKVTEAGKPGISRSQKRSRAEIRTRVANRIKKQLEFLTYSGTDKSELTLVFARDMEKLGSIADQWAEFISSYQQETFIDLRGSRYLNETQKQEVATDIESLFSKAKNVNVTDDETLVDSIFAFEYEEMRDKLGSQLDKTVSSIIQQFFTQLYELKARNILGGLSWGSDVSCRFFDWNHQIEIIEGTDFDRTRQDGNFIVRETGQHGIEMLHTAARREQHLMDAKADTVHEFSGEVPSAFKKVVKQLPECLLPEVRIISGEAFRNEKVRHCLKRKKWGETVIEREVLRDIRVHYDPAISIGDIVLFAWDAEDTVANSKKDTSVEKLIWSITLVIASVVVFLLPPFSYQMLVVYLVLIGSGWIGMAAYSEQMEFQRREHNWSDRFIAFKASACLGGFLISVSYLITGGNMWGLLTAIIFFFGTLGATVELIEDIRR